MQVKLRVKRSTIHHHMRDLLDHAYACINKVVPVNEITINNLACKYAFAVDKYIYIYDLAIDFNANNAILDPLEIRAKLERCDYYGIETLTSED